MSNVHSPSKTLGQIIDDIERMREELLTIQNALQKLEANKPDPSRAAES